MTLRTSVLVLALFAAASAVRADCDRDSDCKTGRVCVANRCVEKKYCMRDKDCPGDQVCDRNSCVPSGEPAQSPPSAYRPYSPATREQSAAQDAGMALQYTKNTWPTAIVDRPLVVAPGMTEMSLGFTKDVSADFGAGQQHPLSGALYARYGVSDRIHAGLDVFTFCVSDCGATGFFNTLSLGAGYAVVATHDVNLVPALTVSFNNVSAGTGSALVVGVSPGFLFGWRLNGGMQIFASGGFIFSTIGRDNAAHPDLFALHFEPRFQIGPRFAIAPYVGYTLALTEPSGAPPGSPSFYYVPVGVNALIVVDRAVDIGAQFEFNDAAAKIVAPINGSGADLRSFTVFLTVRL